MVQPASLRTWAVTKKQLLPNSSRHQTPHLQRAPNNGNPSHMAEIHQLIIEHGIEEARRQAVSKHERMVIEDAIGVAT